MTEQILTENTDPTFVPATAQQVSFMKSLRERKALTDEQMIRANASINVAEEGYLRRTQASEVIDWMLSLQDKGRVEVPEGLHRFDGVIYRVQRSQSGHLYAKELNPRWRKFFYSPGAIKNLSEDTRLTAAQAREFGLAHGICACCGALLTDPKSVEAGIGPVCAKKLNAMWA